MPSSVVKTTELRISHRAWPRLPREVCVIDSVWSCIVGNLKNEQRFIDQDGLFNLLEVRTTEFGFASPNCPKSPSNNLQSPKKNAPSIENDIPSIEETLDNMLQYQKEKAPYQVLLMKS